MKRFHCQRIFRLKPQSYASTSEVATVSEVAIAVKDYVAKIGQNAIFDMKMIHINLSSSRFRHRISGPFERSDH